MKQHRQTPLMIDIGIPALNEEANIARMLSSVAKQKGQSFQVQNIILLSDGSTDNTVKRAEELGLPNLKVIENPKRQGLPTCWYKLFQAAKADVLVLLDADVELSHENVITELLHPMLDSEVTLTSGRSVKQTTATFVDKVMGVSLMLQDYIKEHLCSGKSVYACQGRIVAVKRSIFAQISTPRHTLGNDAFLYFFNKAHDGVFEYAPNATVTCKMAQGFKDFSKQAKRFNRSRSDQANVFGQWIYAEYNIPKVLLTRALLKTSLLHPFYSANYIIYRLRAMVQAKKGAISVTDWETTTTKSLD
jgi:glycosyltransferase involved in cell wall biosynthesis